MCGWFLSCTLHSHPSAVQSVEVHSQLFECVGSHLVLRGFTRSCSSRCCTLHCTSSRCGFPRAPKRGGDGNPVSIGPVTLSHALHVATFNARRLWLQDEATHDGFPMLSRILLSENVVCCIQETNAGDFTTLPVDQPYTYDGPCGSRGREAAFLSGKVSSRRQFLEFWTQCR